MAFLLLLLFCFAYHGRNIYWTLGGAALGSPENAGIGIVEPLFSCNIVAVVGGGNKPLDQPHKVFLWDDRMGDYVAELRLSEPVRNVRLRRDRIFVVLEKAVVVYPLRAAKDPPRPLSTVATAANPLGMLGLSVDDQNIVFACPGDAPGCVYIENSTAGTHRLVEAHKDTASLGTLCLNDDGSLLATTDVYGYTVRIFDTATGAKLAEFQRGRAAATVRAMRFSPDSAWLSLTSSRPTVHIFKVPSLFRFAAGRPAEAAAATAPPPVPPSSASASSPTMGARTQQLDPAPSANYYYSSYLGSMASYFISQGSFAQIRVDSEHCLAGFCKAPGEVVVISAAGVYTRYLFNVENGGDAIRLEEKLIL